MTDWVLLSIHFDWLIVVPENKSNGLSHSQKLGDNLKNSKKYLDMPKESSLKQKTINGLIWSFGDLIANQGIQFIIQIILARLLLPENFGLIGMILIFITIANSFIDSGISQALIREQNTSQADYSTVFYFNLFMSLGMYSVCYVLAPLISVFFNEPQLVMILRVLSVCLIINSLGIIQRVLLIKKIDFKTQTKISAIAGILSGIIGIIFAILGFEVWSLVVKSVSMQIFVSGLLWTFNGWKPSFVFKYASFKRLFGFGWKLMIDALISILYFNIYTILIGKMYSTTHLGYYTNAARLTDIVSQSIASAIQRVTYPVLSVIQEDERLKYGFKKIIKTTAFISFPCMVGFAAIAEPLVSLLFGEKWMSMAIYVQLLCFAGMLYPLNSINLNILKVKGKVNFFLQLTILRTVILTIFIIGVIWLKLGITGLIGAFLIQSYIDFLINSYFSGKEILYSVFEQIKDILLIYSITIIMGVIVYLLGMIFSGNNLLKIIFQITIGCMVYIGMSKLAKIQELNEVWVIILQLIKGVMFRRVKLTNK